MTLSGKKYLITGASSGLGFAIVNELLKHQGTKIVAVARNIKSLENMPKNRVFSLSLDVAKAKNIDFMIDEAMGMMGGIDCIIACAGFGYYEAFKNRDYGHIQRIFQTNVLSPFYTLERFLLKTKGRIAFVAIASMLAKFGQPGMALYSSTKHALDGFHDSYRHEKPKRLHYMTVYPIGMKTNFWKRMAKNIPLSKPMQSPNTAARAILKGLQKGKGILYTSQGAKVALYLNRMLLIIIPLYQHARKIKLDRWLKRSAKQS